MTERERLQKLLARAGYGSRREIEGWIEAGLVTLNGRAARLGDQASPADRITLRGEALPLNRVGQGRLRVLAYHKPIGEVCTRRDEQGRRTVFQALPEMRSSRWINVGRLDINTQGLLLFTNDGELANRLMHPRYGIEREYRVRVHGQADAATLTRLQQGVTLEDGEAHFDRVVPSGSGDSGSHHWYAVTLREGRKREVRRLWEAVGLTVSRLLRVRYGPVSLGRELRRGAWRDLQPRELAALYKAVGMQAPEQAAPRRRRQRQRR